MQVLNNLRVQFPKLTGQIEEYVAEAPQWDLFHINPYKLAPLLKVDEDELINWFIHAVYEGAFDMVWNSLCPLCGANEHQHGSLNQLETDFFCIPCNAPLKGALDDMVEVAFQPRESLRALHFNAYADPQSYRKYFISSNFRMPQPLAQLFETNSKGFFFLQPGASGQVTFDAEETGYRLVCLDHHVAASLQVKPGGQNQVTLLLSEEGFKPEELEIGLGPVQIQVQNSSSRPAGIALNQKPGASEVAIIKGSRPVFDRFLTGKEVLNRQVFRELFPIQDLPADLNLRVGDVTLLFTDLKGSTSLYEEAGDIDAFRLVKDHFVLLTNAVRKHRGAVVKTIGDAVMAAFSRPTDGLAAALEMLQAIQQYNEGASRAMGLKVGLHKGPALAVNANQSLDYFGRTVNIAARVQGEAGSGELWFSEAMNEVEGVKQMLQAANFDVQPKTALLRGIAGEVQLFKAVTALQTL